MACGFFSPGLRQYDPDGLEARALEDAIEGIHVIRHGNLIFLLDLLDPLFSNIFLVSIQIALLCWIVGELYAKKKKNLHFIVKRTTVLIACALTNKAISNFQG